MLIQGVNRLGQPTLIKTELGGTLDVEGSTTEGLLLQLLLEMRRIRVGIGLLVDVDLEDVCLD
jgi:hypothetical protein